MSERVRYSAAVITVSDSCARGEREDVSGAAVRDELASAFDVERSLVLADDAGAIASTLIECVDEGIRLVVTTGGTGISVRDVTPEATERVCEKQLPGIAEMMRSEGMKQTPRAALSRGLCGTRGRSLILNLPGSPKGAVFSLRVVLPLVAHALELLAGNTRHEG